MVPFRALNSLNSFLLLPEQADFLSRSYMLLCPKICDWIFFQCNWDAVGV